ncbi:MAG: chromosome segregation protein SMC [Candidatus Neomarinimicrobiota bacterium]
MYISELKIHGFKSFTTKENLNFGEGITAIVGPNGCGKTNIVDAIRWVLGEQKYSILRSGNMEDVIFNGAKGLKPLSVCEVFLTVHNDKGRLPVEYTDVEIGRRIYRNGESEYFLNKTPCRLKDVQNLFVDTGMGADAYSVIELKMIEQILSDTADDRKRMFEEAAGINKYKSQRKSALRKFEVIKSDLNRIEDIILEVEAKVKGLSLQQKRYKRHENLLNDLRDNEINLASLQARIISEKIEPLKSQWQKDRKSKESNISRENIYDGELNSLRNDYKEQESELSKIRQAIDAFHKDREEIRQRILVSQEKNRADTATIERLDREKTTAADKKIEFRSKIETFTARKKSLQPRIDQIKAATRSKNEEFEKFDRKFKQAEERLDQIQSERWELQKLLTDKRSISLKTRSIIDDKKIQKEKTRQKLDSIKTRIVQITAEKKGLDQKKSVAENKTLELVKSTTLLEKDRTEQSRKIQSLETKNNRQKVELETMESRLQFFNNLMDSKDDFPSGSKFILENTDRFEGVIGTLADLITTDPEHQVAIEAALGDLAYSIVIADREKALKALKIIRSENRGYAVFIPLSEVTAAKSKINPLPKSELALGRAADMITCNREIKPVVNELLRNTVIVKDLSSARKNKSLKGWSLVDVNGNVDGVDNIIKAFSKTDENLAIGRMDKIMALENAAAAIKRELDLGEKQHLQLILKLDGVEKKLSEFSRTRSEIENEMKKVESDLIRNEVEKDQLDEIFETTDQEIADLSETLKSLSKSMAETDKESAKIEQKVEEKNAELEKAGSATLELRSNRDRSHEKYQDERIALLNIENEFENIALQISSAEETIRELIQRQEGSTGEIKSIRAGITERTGQIDEVTGTLESIKGKIHHQESVQNLKQEAFNDTFRRIEELQVRIKSQQKDREELLETVQQYELKIKDYEQEIKLYKDRIRERYNTALIDDIHEDRTSAEIEAKIKRINHSLESIGPVNLAVQTEFEEESKRLSVLKDQKDDLIEAEDNLRETIQRIDHVARNQLKDTFTQIKSNFENLFTLFFEGGQGTLTLVGDPDPLEADIAIHAQPPGKRNQALRMLSAGEKSLTAIALLFAIYQFKPSPYCILDEVDAPLDDVNVKKFTRVLRKFSKETQFIVVTHNKLTMEVADYHYGVTMERKGVSKLVSVKFND